MKKIKDVYDKKAKKVYVYEVESFYDKKTKNTKRKFKMIGQRDPKTGEIKPNRAYGKKKRSHNEKAEGVSLDKDTILNAVKTVERQHYGATYYLHQIAKRLNIEEQLKSIFPNQYQHLLQLVYFLILAPTNAMQQFPMWAKQHYLPYGNQYELTSQRISDLFKRIDMDAIQQFFDYRMAQTKDNEFLYYDTTSISSYSKTLQVIQYGFNKEDDKLPQLNLGVVYGSQTKLPVMYRAINGNISDVMTIDWLIGLLDGVAKERISLVMDRGFYCEKNVLELIDSSIGFLMGTSKRLSFVKEGIDSIRETIENVDAFSGHYRLYGKRTTVRHFKTKSGKSYYPVQLYTYYSQELLSEETTKFNLRIQKLYQALVSDPSVSIKDKPYRTYFTAQEDDKGQVQYQYNHETINEEKRYLGYFTLLSTYKMDPWQALELYRNKELIEDSFHHLKDRLNMRRIRVSSESGLEGKLFIQFIALIMNQHIKNELNRTGLKNEYTQDAFLNALNRIDLLTHRTYGSIVGEYTKAQSDLFVLTNVAPPIQ